VRRETWENPLTTATDYDSTHDSRRKTKSNFINKEPIQTFE